MILINSTERKCLNSNCNNSADKQSSWCSAECFEKWYIEEELKMLNWAVSRLPYMKPIEIESEE